MASQQKTPAKKLLVEGVPVAVLEAQVAEDAKTKVKPEDKSQPNTRVGCSVIVYNSKREVLVGKRKGSHGDGTWNLPGGHIDHGEDPLTCAYREVEEETGLVVKNMKFVGMSNDVFLEEKKHYITILIEAEMEDPRQTPEVKEPKKCDGWKWASWDELRLSMPGGPKEKEEPLFLCVANLLRDDITINPEGRRVWPLDQSLTPSAISKYD